ncbi:winged helix DNA-binding protein [Streptomyces sp. HC44]|uniref:Winged helix DNA-binding protein n=1 Tax=Streptomyces scabichelini TaxID=2711217 RepID=A0A6G4VKU4_9ACTN|nr:MarR family transcriptional regulator [Streptomyces scabichelini]NGO14798.1 winged helix DNA-binding protein [Streptomyces scabichelini]
MEEKTRWLTPPEQRAWRAFIGVHQKLPGVLARALQGCGSLSIADYVVLVALTDGPDGRQHFQELAHAVDWERSRMSHHLRRMTKRGLVTREDCPKDGRGLHVVVTPEGRAAIETAAPQHIATVRRLVIDPLSPEELDALTVLCEGVLGRLEADPP